MSRWAVTLTFALLLAGCSTVWVPGVDDAQVRQDAAACRAEAFYVPMAPQSTFVGAYPFDPANPSLGWSDPANPTLGWSDAARRNQVEEACMEEKGYKKR